ncbi:hypothetical protein [Dyadobacter sediminis]|uniref:Type 1 periplasmic binding fold superfamily protein n=1 Tax=Dyadobacter sediminis TaxID=1493691 RepID=A0A5R9K9C1_9BACT|nr:hypothetical protein [Dyadobacter sediminis]TLU90603.1 hypothetical protein FEM55_18790 [Dyadobacter sediminis]GGC09112.1 hypothetical protein GCM10011325_40100 [Dyadobacter sediminis]
MKMNQKRTLALLLFTALTFTQCKDAGENVEPDDENELITTITLKFAEKGTTTVNTFSYKDTDGDGGNAPVQFDTILLKPNTAYTLTVEMKDESKTPAEDVTEEIQEKAEEHLLIYTPAPATLLTYTYGDKDANNFNIGLKGEALTGAAGTGKLKVQLRHQPGTKNGSAVPGSDDVNLDFTLTVK